ncbi:maleylpyruvate isomerase family mycothiol-dependent enzyme [Mycobacterium sp. C31M]
MSVRDRLRRNDTRLLKVLSTFDAAEWAAPSLCDEWTNHEVLAHLVVGMSTGVAAFVAELRRHRWAFDPANTTLATTLAAARPPRELLDDFHRLVAQPRGLGVLFPKWLLLGDHITHELDMLYALGREPDIPVEDVVAVLNTQVTLPNPFVPAFRNSRGLRLRATDADWSHGNRGPGVSGRAAELVTVLGHRPAVLARLHGDGVAVLRHRLDAQVPRR